MYARIYTQKNKNGTKRDYLYIVKGVRVNGKTKQIKIADLGRIDKLLESGELDNLTQKLATLTKKLEVFDYTKDLFSDWSKEYGPIKIFRRLWELLGLSKLFKKYSDKTKHKFDLSEAILSMVCNRLIDPASKLGTHQWKQNVYEPLWDNLDIQHYYRALDFLMAHKRDFEIDLFNNVRDLFNLKLDLVMFDTTTIKYWGEGKDALILQHGFSKEHRSDLKQLIVGVLMTKEGMPIAHEVWPGNAADIKSFERVIDEVRNKFSIDKIIFVCDKGMISKHILQKLNDEGQEYILGVRLRNMSKEKADLLLREDDFEQVSKHYKIKEVKTDEGRYIVCYDLKTAEYEKVKREYFRKILEDKVDKRSLREWVIKNGYKKYINFEGEGEFVLNEEKLDSEWIYDGKYAFVTNTTLPGIEVSSYYKGLWQIERGFRNLKDEIESGPIYHWTDTRIRGHIFVCFLALVIMYSFKRYLEQLDPELNYSEVLFDLKKLKAQHFKIKDKEIILRTELHGECYKAFKAVGISPPERILSANNFAEISPPMKKTNRNTDVVTTP